mmetsp:Transcript_98249/g.194640  ORF Transcript_98249/g.194640 Transcript_98249/m.194640 type:complete len:209 (-) Transcript_98249:106-732(-)
MVTTQTNSLSLARLLLLGLLALLQVKGWVPDKNVLVHIQCDMCKRAVKEASLYKMRASKSMYNEDDYVDLVDEMCSPWSKKAGKWLKKLDIVREGDNPQLSIKYAHEDPDKEGLCKRECETLKKACLASLKKQEGSLATMLLEQQKVETMQDAICEGSCNKTIPELENWIDEPWEEDKNAAVNDVISGMQANSRQNLKVFRPGDKVEL